MTSRTTSPEQMDMHSLTGRWRQEASTAVHDATGGAPRVALLDCPDYGNVGDSLIGLGQFALLDAASCRITHASAIHDFDAARVRAQVGRDGALLIQGGGNFGDLWPHHQRFRETLVREFRDTPIVQLPQSIYFGDPREAEASAAILRDHPHFTVLCRDDESLERAGALGLDGRMCPDMALVLPPFAGDTAPTHDVVVVRRQDKESADASSRPMPEGWYVQDWTADVPGAVRARRIAAAARRYLPWAAEARVGVWSFRRAFDARVQSGLQLIRRGRVVITDRLHVHVLCCLAGRPHAFVDNSYGKVSAVWRAWTHRVPFAQPCQTWDEAVDWASSFTRSNRAVR